VCAALEHDPAIPKSPGIYLFVDGKTPIYVGQSRNLRARLDQHCQRSSGILSASLAFNIAKEQCWGKNPPKRRAEVQEHRQFKQFFRAAKEGLDKMEVRWIEVESPELRTVLEVYIAVLLGTKYNSFETH
jgi:predicted GIY-YIG superfamily endonuclease